MDIEISSNFERLLFESCGRDAAQIRAMMASLGQSGAFEIEPVSLAAIRAGFSAHTAGEDATLAEIARVYRECGYIIDPHTAVAVAGARAEIAQDPATPVIALATAHPAKFPDAVEKATGMRPPLPAHLADLFDRKERFTAMANDQGAVAAFIRANARKG